MLKSKIEISRDKLAGRCLLSEILKGLIELESKEKVGAASGRKKESLAKILTACPLQVAGAYSLDDGQVTLGGVDTSKVNPQTLESKLCPGLFFTGEVLDVDGDCGGYNLGWAWASAMAAVKGMKG